MNVLKNMRRYLSRPAGLAYPTAPCTVSQLTVVTTFFKVDNAGLEPVVASIQAVSIKWITTLLS